MKKKKKNVTLFLNLFKDKSLSWNYTIVVMEVMEATVKKCWVSISFAFCGFEFFCECRVQHYN